MRALPAVLAIVVSSCGSRTELFVPVPVTEGPRVLSDGGLEDAEGGDGPGLDDAPSPDDASPDDANACPQRLNDIGVWCCDVTCPIGGGTYCCPASTCPGGMCVTMATCEAGSPCFSTLALDCDDQHDCAVSGQAPKICCGREQAGAPVAYCITDLQCQELSGEDLCFPADPDPCPGGLGGTQCLPAKSPLLSGYFSCQ